MRARERIEAAPAPAPSFDTFTLTPPSILPVPDVRQSTTWSCGPSALQAVMMYWGREILESDLMRMCHTTSDGTSPDDVVRVAREQGFDAQLRDGLTVDDLKASVNAGVPVIVECQAWRDGADLQRPWKDIWDSGHFMVVIGVDERNVYFEDPSLLGSRGVIPRAEFEERWHDVDDRPHVHTGIFVQGSKPAPPPAFLHVD